METVQQNSRFTLFSSKFHSDIYSILFAYGSVGELNLNLSDPNLQIDYQIDLTLILFNIDYWVSLCNEGLSITLKFVGNSMDSMFFFQKDDFKSELDSYDEAGSDDEAGLDDEVGSDTDDDSDTGSEDEIYEVSSRTRRTKR